MKKKFTGDRRSSGNSKSDDFSGMGRFLAQNQQAMPIAFIRVL
ncbi:MAG: hypothetical protein U7127_06505 [Phormidium sp.]